MKVVDQVLTKLVAFAEQQKGSERCLDPSRVAQITPTSLLFHYGNIHSQRGQDGILAEILRRTGIHKGRFVEFGAWDGIYLSNCRYLYERGWEAVFIEADPRRYKKLCALNPDQKIIKIHARVGAPSFGVSGDPLELALRKNGIATDTVTLVSIDVDGPDLEIFLDMAFKPPVVLLEGGFNFTPLLVRDVPSEVAWKETQHPLRRIVRDAVAFGYLPVCFYQDCYLVRSDLAAPFPALDTVSLFRDAYCFMDEGHRKYLLEKRRASANINRIETEQFGTFSADPLGYESDNK